MAPSRYAYRVKDHRERAGVSRAELARRVGCSRAYVSDVEAGKRILTFDFAYRLAAVLDLDGPEVLLGRGPDEEHTKSHGRAERPAPSPLPSYSRRTAIAGKGGRKK